jgi:hypothetical protein
MCSASHVNRVTNRFALRFAAILGVFGGPVVENPSEAECLRNISETIRPVGGELGRSSIEPRL